MRKKHCGVVLIKKYKRKQARGTSGKEKPKKKNLREASENKKSGEVPKIQGKKVAVSNLREGRKKFGRKVEGKI